jgi:hypothetical protein
MSKFDHCGIIFLLKAYVFVIVKSENRSSGSLDQILLTSFAGFGHSKEAKCNVKFMLQNGRA